VLGVTRTDGWRSVGNHGRAIASRKAGTCNEGRGPLDPAGVALPSILTGCGAGDSPDWGNGTAQRTTGADHRTGAG
jgi:hypothetical protein